MNDLDRAFRALGLGRTDEALRLTLAAWRAARDPAIAELVEELSRRASRGRVPLPRRPARAFAEAVRGAARSREPLDLVPLVEALPSLDGELLGEALAALDGVLDPRLTAPLCALAPRAAALDLRLLHRVLARLEESLDPRAAALLDRIDLSGAGPRRRGAERRLRRTVRLLARAEAAPLDPRAATSLARLARLCEPDPAGRAERAERARELTRAALESPDDDAPRRALADHLLAEGDPRGELIALQLEASSRPLDRAERETCARLLATHRRTWLGPLARVVEDDAEFERGLPSACRLRADAAPRLAEVVGLAPWSTVRALDVAGLEDPSLLALVTHPAMRSLRALSSVPQPLLVALARAERPLALETLDYLGPRRIAWSPPRPAPDEVALLADLPSLPSLRTLGLNGWRLDPAAFRWLWQSGLGQRINRLRVAAELAALPSWRAEAEQHGALALLELRGAQAPWRASLARGSDGRLSRLDAELGPGATREASLPDLARAIDALPDDALTHVAVRAGRVRRADAAELLRVVTRQRRLEQADLP